MKVLRHIVGCVWSRAGIIWKVVAPHEGPGVLRGVAADAVRNRKELVFENALLRHQIVILRRKSPCPRLTTVDRLWLLVAAAVLPAWRRALAIVQPETLLRWHREGFGMFWRRQSRPGRVERRVTVETISLIREMATKNRLWGAERIRGELLKLGIKLSKRTVQKYMRSVREHRGGGQGAGGRAPLASWATRDARLRVRRDQSRGRRRARAHELRGDRAALRGSRHAGASAQSAQPRRVIR
jgi:hypothetical protein